MDFIINYAHIAAFLTVTLSTVGAIVTARS
jgi:hypothetical protein